MHLSTMGPWRLACEAQTHFRSSLLSPYFSEGEKRRPEMHLRFAGYLEIGWSQHFIYSLLLVRYLSGSRRSATYWWYQRVDRLPLLGLLLFISFKHCYWDNSTSLPTVTDVPSKVSFSFISLACKQRACSQAIISYDFSSTVLSNYICYIFCFNITHGDLPSGRRTGWPDPWSMDPSTDRSTDSPQDPPIKGQ